MTSCGDFVGVTKLLTSFSDILLRCSDVSLTACVLLCMNVSSKAVSQQFGSSSND